MSGTTTFADMYYFENEVAKAVDEVGMRAVLGETILDFPSPDSKSTELAFQYTENFIKSWLGHPRITPSVAPHAPYTVSPENLKKAENLSKKYNVPLQIHLAETTDEVNQIKSKYGKSPVEYVADLGILNERTIAAHSIWLSDEEIKICKAKGVKVSHNPVSNMKLASGIARIPEMVDEGIYVGIGTDGTASNNGLDLVDDLKYVALLHKVNKKDPTIIPAYKVLEMATRDGAEVLNLGDKVGTLEKGKYADITIFDFDQPHLIPVYDVASHIVYAAKGSDVDTVIVHGKILMENRKLKTIDIEKVIKKAVEYRKCINNSLSKK
jgi:5-methylthioadenosine/S-adenosylhomocysteine deaminase